VLIFHTEETDEAVGRTLFEEELMADLGSKFYRVPVCALHYSSHSCKLNCWNTKYSDLWNHLYEFCKACDVRFKFDFQVARATFGNPGKEIPRITSTAGEQFYCDIVCLLLPWIIHLSYRPFRL